MKRVQDLRDEGQLKPEAPVKPAKDLDIMDEEEGEEHEDEGMIDDDETDDTHSGYAMQDVDSFVGPWGKEG